MAKTSTKDRILESALDLFSEKGYDGVGVDLIAENIGIKGPSLYKHYKGKEGILNALIEKLGQYYEQNFGSEQNPGKIPESMEELMELSMARINFTMHDSSIKKVRRLLAMEQFRNPVIAELATKHQITGIVAMFRRIFEVMMENGTMKKGDAEQMALEYTAPVSLMIQMCDRQPEKAEDAMAAIRRHLQCFSDRYRK